MTERTCSVEGCGRKHEARGLCQAHYARFRRGEGFQLSRRRNGSPAKRNERGQKECGVCLRWLPIDVYSINRAMTDGLSNLCRDCHRERQRAWTQGLTLQVVRTLMTAAACSACGSTEAGGKNNQWHIDHDHSCCPALPACGECVRGILCHNCNIALGHAKDDPAVLRALADYLERTPS